MASVFLTDIDDYIAPSQACINPLFESPVSTNQESSKRDKDDEGSTKSRRRRRRVPVVSDEIDSDASLLIKRSDSIPVVDDTTKATVSVADCLACSGCVTSAETVLITNHSIPTLRRNCKPGKTVAFTISPACVADLTRYLDRTDGWNVFLRLATFLHRELGADLILDATVTNHISVLEAAEEFVHRFRLASKLPDNGDGAVSPPSPSIAISAAETKYFPSHDDLNKDSVTIRHKSGRDDDFHDTGSTPLHPQPNQTKRRILPMFASSCPGFVCYVEKTAPSAIPNLCTSKSPMAIAGTLIKHLLPQQLFDGNENVYHVAIMPCHDKKLEAERKDLAWEQLINGVHAENVPDVDLVITTEELLTLLKDAASSLAKDVGDFFDCLPPADVGSHENVNSKHKPRIFHSDLLVSSLGFPNTTTEKSTESYIPINSGGYADYIFRHASLQLFSHHLPPDHPLPWKPAFTTARNKRGRSHYDFCEVTLYQHPDNAFSCQYHEGSTPVLKFATAYGFKNVQLTLQPFADKKQQSRQFRHRHECHHYVEIMACPAGCVNGGGQHRDGKETPKEMRERIRNAYSILESMRTVLRSPAEDSVLKSFYNDLDTGDEGEEGSKQTPCLSGPFRDEAKRMLHTRYHAVPKLELTVGKTAGVALSDTKW